MRLIFALFLLPGSAFAQGLIVKKVSSSANRFSATINGKSPEVGRVFELKDKSGGKCEAAVTKAKGKTAILAFTDCAKRKDIEPGDEFKESSRVSERDKKDKEKKDAKKPDAPQTPPVATPNKPSLEAAAGAASALVSASGGGDDDDDDGDRDDEGVKEKPLGEGQPLDEKQRKKALGERVRFGFYGFYNTANRVAFKSFKESTNNLEGEAEFSTEPAFGAGLEAWKCAANSFGWSAGMTYDSKRNIKTVKIKMTDGTETTNSLDPQPEVAFFTAYANALYTLEKFYIPAGVNYTLPQLSEGKGATSKTEVKGGLGFQFGVGWHFTEMFSLEALYRMLTVKATQEDLGLKYEFERGTMSGAHANLKLSF